MLVIKSKDLQCLLEEETKQSDYFVVNNPAATGRLSYGAIFHGLCTDVSILLHYSATNPLGSLEEKREAVFQSKYVEIVLDLCPGLRLS